MASSSCSINMYRLNKWIWYWDKILVFLNLWLNIIIIALHQWQPTPVLLPGKSQGWRSLVGCSPWGCWGSDTTERLPFHFWLSCIGEGSGNPLQCSCLESPRDGGAWWAAVYGVTQSWTRLKWLSNLASGTIFLFKKKKWQSFLKMLEGRVEVVSPQALLVLYHSE